MNIKGHVWGGSISAVTIPLIVSMIGYRLNIDELKLLVPSILLGSLYPDTDCASIPSRWYAILGVIISIFWYFIGFQSYIFALWLPFIFAKMSKHRGFTHSWYLPLSLTVLPLIMFMLTINTVDYKHVAYLMRDYKVAFFGFSAGLVCHLILDQAWFKKLMTKVGIVKAKK